MAEFYKQHTITYAGTVTNYPVKVTVHYGSGVDSAGDVYTGSKCRVDFGDIRFKLDDGTALSSWMESKIDSDNAVFWVKLPSITTSLVIRVYYGDSAKTDASDGSSVFHFYESFKTNKPVPFILRQASSPLVIPTFASSTQTGYSAKTAIVATTLAVAANINDTTLTLTDASGFRTDASKVIINGAEYTYTSRSGNVLSGMTIPVAIAAGTVAYPFEWGQAIHPSILDLNGTQWQTDTGYRYWMAFTPFPNADDDYENPHLVASNDLTTWVVPNGLANPIAEWPTGTGYNADTEVIYDTANNRLLVYYIKNGSDMYRVAVSNTYALTNTQQSGAYITSAASNSMAYDGTKWWDFAYNPGTGVLSYKTATTPDSGWSAASNCTFTPNFGTVANKFWHFSIRYYSGLAHPWVMLAGNGPNSGAGFNALYVATSDDGINWINYQNPIAYIEDTLGSHYRPSFFIDSGTIHIFYSYTMSIPVVAGTTKWNMGYMSGNYADVLTNAAATSSDWVPSYTGAIDYAFHPATYNPGTNHKYSAELTGGPSASNSKFTRTIGALTDYEVAARVYDPATSSGYIAIGMSGAAGFSFAAAGSTKYQAGFGDTTGVGDGTMSDFTPSIITRSVGWKTVRMALLSGTVIVSMDGNANTKGAASRTTNMTGFYLRVKNPTIRYQVTDLRVRPLLATEPAHSTWGAEEQVPVPATAHPRTGFGFRFGGFGFLMLLLVLYMSGCATVPEVCPVIPEVVAPCPVPPEIARPILPISQLTAEKLKGLTKDQKEELLIQTGTTSLSVLMQYAKDLEIIVNGYKEKKK